MSEIYKVAVAFAREGISDVRFGQMKQVRIYELEEDGVVPLEVRNIPTRKCESQCKLQGCHGKDEEFVNAVAALLSDCKYLVLEDIGGFPSRILLRNGIEVLTQSGEIDQILNRLNDYLRKRRL